MLDKDRLAPLLRAFKANNIGRVTILCSICPDAASISDSSGKTVWHLLLNQTSDDYYAKQLIQNEQLREVLKLKDKDGNTPLHFVIKANQLNILEIFFNTWKYGSDQREIRDVHVLGCHNRYSRRKSKWLTDLLDIANNAGETPADLIGELPTLPNKVRRLFIPSCFLSFYLFIYFFLEKNHNGNPKFGQSFSNISIVIPP